jgi:hypothetical protein
VTHAICFVYLGADAAATHVGTVRRYGTRINLHNTALRSRRARCSECMGQPRRAACAECSTPRKGDTCVFRKCTIDSRCRWAETRIPSTVVRGEQMLRTVTPFGIEQPTRNRLLLTRQLTQLTLFPDTAGGNRFSPLGATILSVLHWCLFWCLPARCSFYSHQCNKTTRRKHAHNRLLAATPLVQQTLAQPNKICTRHVEDGVADIVVYVPIAFLRARTQPAAS